MDNTALHSRPSVEDVGKRSLNEDINLTKEAITGSQVRRHEILNSDSSYENEGEESVL